jgi:hypothetical protein
MFFMGVLHLRSRVLHSAGWAEIKEVDEIITGGI